MPSPFAAAIRDHHRGERGAPLYQRDGETVREHPIEEFYFGTVDPDDDRTAFLDAHLAGPLVDLGAGAGRDAVYFQQRCETVALETEAALVETLRARGVERAVQGDMFALAATFDPDRFASALAFGTQLGLAKSTAGLREFFAELGVVTTADATAVVDSYDPDHGQARELLGYRGDRSAGLAFRVMHFEYDGRSGETLLFRLFSPDRLAAAARESGWAVREWKLDPADGPHYLVALEKA